LYSIKAGYQMYELHLQSLFQAGCTLGKTLPTVLVTFVFHMVRKLARVDTCTYLTKGLCVLRELEIHKEKRMQLSGRHLASGLGAAVMTVKLVRWGSVERCAMMHDVGRARQHW